MSDTKPVKAARVRLSGTSGKWFTKPEIGEQRVFTVLATCTAVTEQDTKTSGVRRTATLKIDEILEGVDESIVEYAEPALFDVSADGKITTTDDEDEDGDDPAPAADPAHNVTIATGECEPVRIGKVIEGLNFRRGPVYSGGR